jgi:hypothetical protein
MAEVVSQRVEAPLFVPGAFTLLRDKQRTPRKAAISLRSVTEANYM